MLGEQFSHGFVSCPSTLGTWHYSVPSRRPGEWLRVSLKDNQRYHDAEVYAGHGRLIGQARCFMPEKIESHSQYGIDLRLD